LVGPQDGATVFEVPAGTYEFSVSLAERK